MTTPGAGPYGADAGRTPSRCYWCERTGCDLRAQGDPRCTCEALGRVPSDLDAMVEQGWHVNCPTCGYLSVYFGSRDEALFVAEAHALSGHNGPVDDEADPAGNTSATGRTVPSSARCLVPDQSGRVSSPYPTDTKWRVSAHWCRGVGVIESGSPRLGDPMPPHEPCGDKPCEITTISGPMTTPARTPSSRDRSVASDE